eukprot:CAMPEP_0198366958 /NCGR_PEP_ID=MMETSP1450-20131203/154943_1 /TAXON_ID=753684 ORGANISM="Madagascaria erythrocladiodes, Strain CCMP3234" /NCGR_SAMPLE_ID=MMETSP1450 /ASSEMBLY_ACC=CAM_ASM_001115 /LENGTH=110 /DNA_ID=CAMNT_0044074427 /DNA_START=675 /DNA_END=1005 /DNA_ORIENTATION=+
MINSPLSPNAGLMDFVDALAQLHGYSMYSFFSIAVAFVLTTIAAVRFCIYTFFHHCSPDNGIGFAEPLSNLTNNPVSDATCSNRPDVLVQRNEAGPDHAASHMRAEEERL